jgi:hypothetical protein
MIADMRLREIWRAVARLLLRVLGERVWWLPARIADRVVLDGT